MGFGKLVNEHYPVTPEGATKGYIFLEFTSHANAVEAVKSTNNYKLDKMHTFVVNLFSDFDKYENIPDEWEAPLPQPYKDQGSAEGDKKEFEEVLRPVQCQGQDETEQGQQGADCQAPSIVRCIQQLGRPEAKAV